jgi:hypothetical protein
LPFPQENRTYGISGINLCNLGAELSILSAFFFAIWGHFFAANLGTSCIPYTI